MENPNCLFGLGEDEEGIWTGEPDLGDNPEDEARDSSRFAGIEVHFCLNPANRVLISFRIWEQRAIWAACCRLVFLFA